MDLVTKDIKARQVLDSAGLPTIEVDVLLSSGASSRVTVPSIFPAKNPTCLELRDQDEKFYSGKSVLKAVWNINQSVRELLINNTADQKIVDQLLLDLDGTKNKSSLGGNAIFAVSLAIAKTVAKTRHLPLYAHIAELAAISPSLPLPMFNLISGGKPNNWTTNFQKYYLIPKNPSHISTALRLGSEISASLKSVLKKENFETSQNSEGAFTPKIKDHDNEPFAWLKTATERLGYKLDQDVVFALKVAASDLFKNDHYELKNGDWKSPDDLLNWYDWIVSNYPLASLIDGFAKTDHESWKKLTKRLKNRCQIATSHFINDPDFATTFVLRPSQIGTLSEIVELVKNLKSQNIDLILANCPNETEDVFLTHFAVGLGANYLAAGAPFHSENLCKYNELLRISEKNPKLPLYLLP